MMGSAQTVMHDLKDLKNIKDLKDLKDLTLSYVPGTLLFDACDVTHV